MITPFELADAITKELIKANSRIKELEEENAKLQKEIDHLNDALGGSIITLIFSLFSKDELEKIIRGGDYS